MSGSGSSDANSVSTRSTRETGEFVSGPVAGTVRVSGVKFTNKALKYATGSPAPGLGCNARRDFSRAKSEPIRPLPVSGPAS